MKIPQQQLEHFQQLLDQANNYGSVEKMAMSLATIDADGKPSSRMVLLKSFDENGFVFYTNLGSKKSQHIINNNKVCLCFDWQHINNNTVKIKGRAVQINDDMADKYYNSRYLFSRIGAWASKQSQPMIMGRASLVARVFLFTIKYIANFMKVKRPEFWSGYLVEATSIEFIEKIEDNNAQ